MLQVRYGYVVTTILFFAGFASCENISSEFTVPPLKYYSLNFPVYGNEGNLPKKGENPAKITVT
jgi:hypothetical protein